MEATEMDENADACEDHQGMEHALHCATSEVSFKHIYPVKEVIIKHFCSKQINM